MKYSGIIAIGGFTQVEVGEGQYSTLETVESYINYYGDREVDPTHEVSFRNNEAKIKVYQGMTVRSLITFKK